MHHSTTILALRLNDRAVMAGDGHVTFGQTVMKHHARKIRKLYHDRILAGFAGSAADSFALFSRFESKLEQYRGNLERAAVELARDWRTDRQRTVAYDGFIHFYNQHRSHGALGWSTPAATLSALRDNLPDEHT